jgi:hypothetical protein
MVAPSGSVKLRPQRTYLHLGAHLKAKDETSNLVVKRPMTEPLEMILMKKKGSPLVL